MDGDDSKGLLRSMLGFFARKRPEKTAQPASLRSRTREAWLRTDAFLQHDADEFDKIDPESLARTLRKLENYVQYDSDRELVFVSALEIHTASSSLSASEFRPTNTNLWSREPSMMCRIQSFRRCAA